MRTHPSTRFPRRGLIAALLLFAPLCNAQQGDPTPRRHIEPWDKAKVSQIEAKRWLIGAQQQPGDTQVLGTRGSKTCITNVGTTPAPQGPGTSTPRYGPTPGGRQSRVVVVNGSVINVCK